MQVGMHRNRSERVGMKNGLSDSVAAGSGEEVRWAMSRGE